MLSHDCSRPAVPILDLGASHDWPRPSHRHAAWRHTVRHYQLFSNRRVLDTEADAARGLAESEMPSLRSSRLAARKSPNTRLFGRVGDGIGGHRRSLSTPPDSPAVYITRPSPPPPSLAHSPSSLASRTGLSSTGCAPWPSSPSSSSTLRWPGGRVATPASTCSLPCTCCSSMPAHLPSASHVLPSQGFQSPLDHLAFDSGPHLPTRLR